MSYNGPGTRCRICGFATQKLDEPCNACSVKYRPQLLRMQYGLYHKSGGLWDHIGHGETQKRAAMVPIHFFERTE